MSICSFYIYEIVLIGASFFTHFGKEQFKLQ